MARLSGSFSINRRMGEKIVNTLSSTPTQNSTPPTIIGKITVWLTPAMTNPHTVMAIGNTSSQCLRRDSHSKPHVTHDQIHT